MGVHLVPARRIRDRAPAMPASADIQLGIVVERRPVVNPWLTHCWRPTAVIVDAPAADPWRLLYSAGGSDFYHAGTLPLELFRRETEDYKVALSNTPPVVYVVLRGTDDEDGADAGYEVRPLKVTASPFEAQQFLDSGDDIVEAVVMPEALAAWVEDFVNAHHVEEPFRKRRRTPHATAAEDPFARRPLVTPRRGDPHGR